MKKLIATAILKLIGWKVEVQGDVKVLDRCILVVAPHTSNMDYILGILTYAYLDKPLKVIIKDAHTKAFYGGIVKSLGGIGIDRSQRNNLVEVVSNLFQSENFSLVITPEGTRSRVRKWKLGFYQMAMKTGVPIAMATADYKRKTVFLGKEVKDYQNRSKESVLDEMQEHFQTFEAKYPENYNPKIY